MDDERTVDEARLRRGGEPSEAAAEAPSPSERRADGMWRMAEGRAQVSLSALRAARREAPLPVEADTEWALAAPQPRAVLHRRAFILAGFWGSLGALLAAIFGGLGLDFLWPLGVKGFGAAVDVSAAKIPKPGDEPVRVPEGRFWLVNLAPGEAESPGGLLALYQKCPHLGCTVPWRSTFEFAGRKGWFRCPCHGSTYTKEGGVLVFGPAPRSLDTMAIEVKPTGDVTVQSGKISKGGSDNPKRAVPYSGPSA
ncbi:MAG: Rieske (2Fe-2S) protein [Chloroflexota bacterium]|nr:Rieske (2Fe-2S) protein [Chloroflexota bacterium]